MNTSVEKSIKKALYEAVAIIGGQTATAARLTPLLKKANKIKKPLRQGHIATWLKDNRKGPPAEYCPELEFLSGITRKRLRPDVYGDVNV